MLVHNNTNLPSFTNAVLTIGTYDGVHYGHQQIIKRVVELAKSINGESILMTFNPHPRFIINPNEPLKLITTFDEKIDIIANYGLNHIVALPFSKEFASMDAIDYIKEVIVKYFHPKIIVIGYDHKFGKNRTGDIHLLKKMGPEYGFVVEEIEKQTIEEIAVSSTKVRKALLNGDITEANNLLVHPFSLKGIVVDGDKMGRKIGFPTANIKIENEHKLIPPSGVYAVKVEINNKLYDGALSIGVRPTFDFGPKLVVEVFIIDFNLNIYGETIKIILYSKIRGQEKYETVEALIEQIEDDVAKCKNILKSIPLK